MYGTTTFVTTAMTLYDCTVVPGGINTHHLSADMLHTRAHSLTGVCLHCRNCNTYVSLWVDGVWLTVLLLYCYTADVVFILITARGVDPPKAMTQLPLPFLPLFLPFLSFPLPLFSLPFPSVRSRTPLNPVRGSGGALWAPPAGSGAEPQPKSNLVHFSLKIWHLVATILNFVPPNFLIFVIPPRISVTHFASPGVPLDAPDQW